MKEKLRRRTRQGKDILDYPTRPEHLQLGPIGLEEHVERLKFQDTVGVMIERTTILHADRSHHGRKVQVNVEQPRLNAYRWSYRSFTNDAYAWKKRSMERPGSSGKWQTSRYC